MCSGTHRAPSSLHAEGAQPERAIRQAQLTCSSARRRLTAAAARAGLDAGEREELVGAVLRELAVRVTPAQWRELCGWLPWDVRSLAGARPASRVAPRDDLAAAVAADTGLPRTVTLVAVRTVLGELGRILPAWTIPARLACGVPGL
jgi:hypothetical protein